MCRDVCEALPQGLNRDMYSEFPLFIESVQGTDTNFELVTSTTLKPLRLYYSHHVVQEVLGYIFVFTRLEGFRDWTGTEDG